MTWVKVCGLTRREDVEAAVAAGADAVGFVIAPESPRRTDPATVAELAAGIDAMAVLVTVDLKPAELIEAVAIAGVDGVQPHGRHSDIAATTARDLGLFVLRPVAVRDYLEHRSATTTDLYAKITDGALVDIAQRKKGDTER